VTQKKISNITDGQTDRQTAHDVIRPI